MNLVVGATGFLGGEICRQLIEKGKLVRAMVRRTSNPETVARLKGYGAEIVEGDLKDRASLDKACRGVEAVITTVATTLSRQPDDSIQKTDLEGQKSLVDAVTHPVLMEYPDWFTVFDFDREQAATTRRRLLDWVTAEGMLVFGFHFPFPGLGHVQKREDGWRWQALEVGASQAVS